MQSQDSDTKIDCIYSRIFFVHIFYKIYKEKTNKNRFDLTILESELYTIFVLLTRPKNLTFNRPLKIE